MNEKNLKIVRYITGVLFLNRAVGMMQVLNWFACCDNPRHICRSLVIVLFYNIHDLRLIDRIPRSLVLFAWWLLIVPQFLYNEIVGVASTIPYLVFIVKAQVVKIFVALVAPSACADGKELLHFICCVDFAYNELVHTILLLYNFFILYFTFGIER